MVFRFLKKGSLRNCKNHTYCFDAGRFPELFDLSISAAFPESAGDGKNSEPAFIFCPCCPRPNRPIAELTWSAIGLCIIEIFGSAAVARPSRSGERPRLASRQIILKTIGLASTIRSPIDNSGPRAGMGATTTEYPRVHRADGAANGPRQGGPTANYRTNGFANSVPNNRMTSVAPKPGPTDGGPIRSRRGSYYPRTWGGTSMDKLRCRGRSGSTRNSVSGDCIFHIAIRTTLPDNRPSGPFVGSRNISDCLEETDWREP